MPAAESCVFTMVFGLDWVADPDDAELDTLLAWGKAVSEFGARVTAFVALVKQHNLGAALDASLPQVWSVEVPATLVGDFEAIGCELSE